MVTWLNGWVHGSGSCRGKYQMCSPRRCNGDSRPPKSCSLFFISLGQKGLMRMNAHRCCRAISFSRSTSARRPSDHLTIYHGSIRNRQMPSSPCVNHVSERYSKNSVSLHCLHAYWFLTDCLVHLPHRPALEERTEVLFAQELVPLPLVGRKPDIHAQSVRRNACSCPAKYCTSLSAVPGCVGKLRICSHASSASGSIPSL